MKYPNGIETNRQIEGIDWSRNQIDIYDGQNWREYSSLEEYAKDPLNHGKMIILEASGLSFETQLREPVLELFRKADILAYCFNSIYTEKYRRKNKIKGKDKFNPKNQTDAQVIFLIATTTNLSLALFSSLIDTDPVRANIKKFLVEDRFLYNHKNKEQLIEEYINEKDILFPDILLTKAGELRKQVGSILAVAKFVREEKRGFREFRRQLGNYGNGYGSMPRSEFYHHLVKNITNSILGRHPMKSMNDLTEKQRIVHKNVMRGADKAAKWLWQQTA